MKLSINEEKKRKTLNQILTLKFQFNNLCPTTEIHR